MNVTAVLLWTGWIIIITFLMIGKAVENDGNVRR